MNEAHLLVGCGTQDPQPFCVSMIRGAARGFTLVELTVVVVIIAAIAGLAIQTATNASAEAAEAATKHQMSAIRAAMLGGSDPSAMSYRRDCGEMPRYVSDLLVRPPGMATFQNGAGWRGPYVFVPRGRFPLGNAAFAVYARTPLDEPAILDGWGNPIVLQIPEVDPTPPNPTTPNEARHMRLVSAGPNGFLETADDALFPVIGPSDDLVLYLQVADQRQP